MKLELPTTHINITIYNVKTIFAKKKNVVYVYFRNISRKLGLAIITHIPNC